MLIDTHCHLDFPELSVDRAGLLQRAKEAGVGTMISIATHKSRWDNYLKIAAENENVFCSIGVHPHHVHEDGENATAEEIVAVVNANPKVVGIGECGLDYYYNTAPADVQKAAFAEHIKACQQTGLPLIVHARSADDDMATQLEDMYKAAPYSGLLHCFSSGYELAMRALDIGFYISFSGIVTFKNAEDIRTTARDVPLDKILVETDAPYLAPVPMRGKINEPAYVAHTAQYLADLKGVSLAEFTAITTANAKRVFSRLPQ